MIAFTCRAGTRPAAFLRYLARFSRTRLPEIAADVALWLGFTFRPIQRAGHLLILLEAEEV